MTQQEFMKQLKEALEQAGVNNVTDILNDYQEHFTHGLQNGKTQDEISAKLGNPKTIAKAFETEALIEKMKSPETGFQFETALRVLGRMIVLAPFTLIVFFIPGLIAFSLLVSGWSVAIALGAAAFGAIGMGLKFGLFGLSLWLAIGVGATSMALLGVGAFGMLVMFMITKTIMMALINYLQWNLKFVMEK